MSYRDELAAAHARVEALTAERNALVRERDALLLELDGRSSPKTPRIRLPAKKARSGSQKAHSDPYVEPFVTFIGALMGVFILFGAILSLQAC